MKSFGFIRDEELRVQVSEYVLKGYIV